ncbi:hypothetical protein P8452_55233 [Trifolium repens]|nr:hypothetical protein P8452_55233 [Trifolium repens]
MHKLESVIRRRRYVESEIKIEAHRKNMKKAIVKAIRNLTYTNLVARANLNNRGAVQISIRLNSSEQLQIALIGLIPLIRKAVGYSHQLQFGQMTMLLDYVSCSSCTVIGYEFKYFVF